MRECILSFPSLSPSQRYAHKWEGRSLKKEKEKEKEKEKNIFI